jgi:hypothetical protein
VASASNHTPRTIRPRSIGGGSIGAGSIRAPHRFPSCVVPSYHSLYCLGSPYISHSDGYRYNKGGAQAVEAVLKAGYSPQAGGKAFSATASTACVHLKLTYG